MFLNSLSWPAQFHAKKYLTALGEGPGTRSLSGFAVLGASFRPRFAPRRSHREWPGAVVRCMLEEPGRRIGPRGDATQRRPGREDRGGRQDAAPRHPGIGPKAINPLTVFEITGQRNEPDRCSPRRTPHPGDCHRRFLPTPPPPSPRAAGPASSISPPFFPTQLALHRLAPPTLFHRFHLPRLDGPGCPRASTSPPFPADSTHDTVARVPGAEPS